MSCCFITDSDCLFNKDPEPVAPVFTILTIELFHEIAYDVVIAIVHVNNAVNIGLVHS